MPLIYHKAPQCSAIKQDGTQCKAGSVDGSKYCAFHGGRKQLYEDRELEREKKRKKELAKLDPDKFETMSELVGTALKYIIKGIISPQTAEIIIKMVKLKQQLATAEKNQKRLEDKQANKNLTDEQILNKLLKQVAIYRERIAAKKGKVKKCHVVKEKAKAKVKKAKVKNTNEQAGNIIELEGRSNH